MIDHLISQINQDYRVNQLIYHSSSSILKIQVFSLFNSQGVDLTVGLEGGPFVRLTGE